MMMVSKLAEAGKGLTLFRFLLEEKLRDFKIQKAKWDLERLLDSLPSQHLI